MDFEPFKYISEWDHPETIPAKFGSNLPSSYSFEENIFFGLNMPDFRSQQK